MIKKIISTLILATGLSYAGQEYQVCGTNSQTKITACDPIPFDKQTADVNTQFLNNSMKENNLDKIVKFRTRKFKNTDVAPSPSVLYPAQPTKPAVTPEPDQKV